MWDPIDQLLKNPKATLKALDERIRKKSKAAEYEAQTKEYQAELAEKAREEERLVSAMKRGKLTDERYDREMDKTSAEVATIQAEIDRLQQLIETEKAQEELKHSLASLAKAYRKKYGKIDRPTKEAIIRKLVNKITIHQSGKIEVDYAIPKIQKRLIKYGGDDASELEPATRRDL